MNKKISFPIAIIIIVVWTVLVGGIVAWQYFSIPGIEILPLTLLEKPPEDETAEWKTYKNEEYGFEFRYPPEWGDITSTRVEDVTIGWYGVTYFSFEKEDDVYFSIINIKDWPDGIYEQGYEGVDLLKIDMNKQKQYIKEASEEDGCYESVSSQYNKVFKFQGLEDCQVIFLTKEIKAQLDYPYFLPLFGLSKQYTFYKENHRFIFGLRFSEFAQILRERSGPERQYAIPLYEQEFIEKFKNLLKQKIAESPYTSPATVGLSESFDKILSTFRFLDWQLFSIEEYGFSMKIYPDYIKTREEEIERGALRMKIIVFSKDSEKVGITIDKEPSSIKMMRPVLFDVIKLGPEEWQRGQEYYSEIGLVEPGAEFISKENIERGTCIGIQLLEKKGTKYERNLILTSLNFEDMYVTIFFEYYTKDSEAEILKMIETIECTK